MLDILYFASFKEMLGKGEETLPAEHLTVESLLKSLANRGEIWQKSLLDNKNLQIAINHNIVDRQASLKPGDEVAFFPPVTGG